MMKYLPLATLLLSNLTWAGILDNEPLRTYYEPCIWFFMGEKDIEYSFARDCSTANLAEGAVCVQYDETGYVWADMIQPQALSAVPVPAPALLFGSALVALVTISRIKRKPCSG